MKYMYRFKQLILASGDLIAFFSGFLLSLITRSVALPSVAQVTSNMTLFFFVFLFWIVANYINGLYDLKLIRDAGLYKRIIQTSIFSLAVGVIFFYITPNRYITPKTILILSVIFGYMFAYVWRVIYNAVIGEKTLQTNIMFLGYSAETAELLNILRKETNLGYHVVALIDPEHLAKTSDHPNIKIIDDINQIDTIAQTYHVTTIVTSPHLEMYEEITKKIYSLLFSTVSIIDLTSFYETLTGRIPPTTFSEGWFIKNIRSSEHIVYDKLRRLTDIIAAIALGVVLLITSPIIIPLIHYTSQGPVIFRQKRIGKNGYIFWIYKFRTMYALAADGSAETQGAQFAEKDDERITKIGKLLRKTRLDEIPQVWNLLKGDVTLIGPRPERPEIVQKLEAHMPYYALRHMVKPGITGWAAVHQHYTDTLETSLQKLQYDLYYIKNKSWLLDLSIILKTINVVLRGMGQ